MVKAILIRTSDNGKQTLGKLILFDLNTVVFECATLELSYKENKRRISCIPQGTYKVVKRYSEKYKNHFHVLDVQNRDWILIHSGNFNIHTLGCVIVGSEHKDINADGQLDVINSTNTLKKLNTLTDDFELTIKSIF